MKGERKMQLAAAAAAQQCELLLRQRQQHPAPTLGRMKVRPAAAARAMPTYVCCSWACRVARWRATMSSFSCHLL